MIEANRDLKMLLADTEGGGRGHEPKRMQRMQN